jgi:CRISPR-associated protein Cas5d
MDITVKAWAPFALFTKPETPVERVSYPIMTPPAARGVLGGIYAHPDMEWEIRHITALKPWWTTPRTPVQTIMLTRNEVKKSPSFITSMSDWNNGKLTVCNPCDDRVRVQRASLILCDVAYRICATVRGMSSDHVIKCINIAKRRLEKGQYYHKPYFGCREFACDVALSDGNEEPWDDFNMDCGFMIHEIMWPDTSRVKLFAAKIRKGVLHCDSTQKGPNGEPPVKLIGA